MFFSIFPKIHFLLLLAYLLVPLSFLYAHLDSKSKQESAESLVNALKVTDTNKKENEESASSSSHK